MKKLIAFAGIAVLASSVFAQKILKVGATPEPHAEILNLVKEDLAAKGIDLQIVEFTDYVTPNDAVEAGDIDANYFQHIPYLESFNKEKGYHLVNAAGVHVEPVAFYSNKIKKLDDLKKKATIAIPNDPTIQKSLSSRKLRLHLFHEFWAMLTVPLSTETTLFLPVFLQKKTVSSLKALLLHMST